MKSKIKIPSGSVKVDTTTYTRLADYCNRYGIKISFFASGAIADKLDRVEKLEKEQKGK